MGFFIASGMGNGFSTYVTKVTSATNSIVFDQSRIIFVWVFFLTYGGVGHETFSLEKLFGFTMICLGVLVFNQIINLEPYFEQCLCCCAVNKSNRNNQRDEDDMHGEYMSLSAEDYKKAGLEPVIEEIEESSDT